MATSKPRRSPGEGGVYEYRLRNGEKRYYWKATIQVGNERKPVVRRGFTSRPEAARDMRAAMKQSDDGLFADPGKVTVGEWLDTWLAGLRVSASTRGVYGQMAKVVIKPRLGDEKLAKLTSTRIDAFYRELEANGSKQGTPLAPRSVRLAAAVMSMALKAAVEAEPPLLSRNPATKAKPPLLDDDPEAIKAWTPEQLDRFLTWADEHDPEHASLWRFAAATGMRRGELLALDWRDVSGDVVVVRRSAIPGPGRKPVIAPTKTRRSRAVALDDETVALLRTWRARRGGLHLGLARDPAPVFGDENGERHSPGNVTAWFIRAVERCQRDLGEDLIPRITLHGLRHTMVSTWLAAGIPVKVVAERTGHSVTLMLNTYAHVMPGSQAAAARQVAAARRLGAPTSDESLTNRPNLRSVEGGK